MQVFFFFGIALCLVVDTSTKSVSSSYNETGEYGSPLKSPRQVKVQCDEEHKTCKNGGECTNSGEYQFCRCRKGTEGDFCETVSECKIIVCGEGASCVYDVQSGYAICQCNDKTLTIDPRDIRCKEQCNKENEDCKNGGVCAETRGLNFCRCPAGTDGDFCENVEDCANVKCEEDTICVYDVKSKKAVCKCKDEALSFDPTDKRCKKQCDKAYEYCENGGVCTETEGLNFCRCETGTDGDFCEIVKDCTNVRCEEDAICVYDVKSKKAVCKCKDKALSFDPTDKTCKKICDLQENEDKYKGIGKFCIRNDTVEDGFTCVCETGKVEDKDGKCIDICELQKNKETCIAIGKVCNRTDSVEDGFTCVCETGKVEDISGTCIVCDCGKYSTTCHYDEDGKKVCECLDGFEDKNGQCTICDCGKYSTTCRYDEDGKKVCECLDGFEDKNGQCTICDCGEDSWYCEYDEDGKKECDCNKGYADKNGKCEICDCGEGSFRCQYDEEGKKECLCFFPYADKNGKCEICDCGNHSFSCEYQHEEKVCNCHTFYGDKDGQCEICFCGINMTSCRYDEGGNKVCDCPEGYIDINGQCEKIPLTSTFRPIEITSNATTNSSVGETLKSSFSKSTVTATSTVRPTREDPCIENPCQNGGTCVFVDNSLKCLCRKPFLGILCETDPCDWNPCRNGGMCMIQNETVKCYCKGPFTGEFCETPIKIDVYVVTLVAASVFLGLVVIFVTCVKCQRCHVSRTV